MPLLKVDAVGDIGLVTDRPGHDLPVNAWTSLRNVRAAKGYMERSFGEAANTSGAPLDNDLYFIDPVVSDSTVNWVYASGTKVYAFAGTTHFDITRAAGDYTLNPGSDAITSWWLNGIYVLNNSADAPQLWNPINQATPLVDLPNWPAGYRAKALRGYRNYLIALDINDGADRYPTRVMWSAAADAGSVPPTWDPTVTTQRAGDAPLSDTPGRCLDCLPQRDTNIIYKEDATYIQQWIGGNDVFRFIPVSLSSGIMADNCVAPFGPGNHIVLNQYADIMEVNGSSVRSLISGKVRTLIQNELNGVYRNRCFAVRQQEQDEVWICYPSGNNEYPNRAVMLNYKTGTVTVRDITPVRHMALGPYDPNTAANVWNTATGSWDEQVGGWSALNYDLGTRKILAASDGGYYLEGNSTTLADGSGFEAFLERKHIPFSSSKVIATSRKMVRRVRPIVEASQNVVMNVRVGSQETREGPITWQGPFEFNTATDEWVDFLLDGKFISIRFSSTDSTRWKFHGYEIEWDYTGD